MNRRHRVFLSVEIASLTFALLPWLGFGGYSFAVPGTDIYPPRINLFSEESIPLGKVIYSIMEFPLHLLGTIQPLDDVVFFQGEGVVTVRPFMISVFWFLIGIAFIWISIRRFVLHATYGHLTSRYARPPQRLA